VTPKGSAPSDPRGRDATSESRLCGCSRPSQYVSSHTHTHTNAHTFGAFLTDIELLCVDPMTMTTTLHEHEKTEALHAQIGEILRGILSDDEFAAEAPG
jgi:hypothetical protein